MTNINSCMFCGGNETYVQSERLRKSKTFFVMCGHCAARGPHQMAVLNVDGVFEESDEYLIEQAIYSWNDSGYPTFFDNIKRFFYNMKYTTVLYLEFYREKWFDK